MNELLMSLKSTATRTHRLSRVMSRVPPFIKSSIVSVSIIKHLLIIKTELMKRNNNFTIV